MRRVARLVVLAVVAAAFASAAHADDWPSYRADAALTGSSADAAAPDVASVSRLAPLWHESLDVGYGSGVVVAGGRIYTQSNGLSAYDASTGASLWRVPFDGSVAQTADSIPTVAGGAVYVAVTQAMADRTAVLSSYDAASGALRWTTRLAAVNVYTSPTVVAGVVYLAVDGSLDAFDATTGAVRWTADVGAAYSTAAVVAGTVYVVGNAGSGSTLYALDAQTGTVRWSAAAGGDVPERTPAVADGLVFVASSDHGGGDGRVFAFAAGGCGARSCSPAWTTPVGTGVGDSVAVSGGRVFVGADAGVKAIDERTGAVVWSASTTGVVVNAPTVANGVVYVGTEDQNTGHAYAFPAACSGTCAPLWQQTYTDGRITKFWRAPIVANGTVYATCFDGTTYAYRVPAPPSGPTNDAFAAAMTLSGAAGSTTGDTTGATREQGEPTIVGNDGGHSVWFSWTASAAGPVTVDTHGSGFDTTLAVYTGSSLGSLSKVVEDDDSPSDTTSTVTFTASAGTTYRIQLDGYNGTSRPPWYGSYQLDWSGLADSSGSEAPANDAFANVAQLSGAAGSMTGDTTGATREQGEPTIVGNDGGHSVWFSWTASAAGPVTVDTHGSAFDTTLAVYTGSSLGSLSKVAEDDDSPSDTTSTVTFTASAGTTYRIQLDGYNGTSRPPWYGSYRLSWSGPADSSAGEAPANDGFANAAAATTGATGDTTGATHEQGEPTIVGNAGGHSVWFTWTAPASGTATIDTHGSAFDTTLAVYTGSSLGSLSKVAEDDDSPSDTTSTVTFTASAGTTYRIQLDGYNGTSRPPWYGAYRLAITPPS